MRSKRRVSPFHFVRIFVFVVLFSDFFIDLFSPTFTLFHPFSFAESWNKNVPNHDEERHEVNQIEW